MKPRMVLRACLPALVLLMPHAASSEGPLRTLGVGQASPQADIEQVAWLAGTWRGEIMHAPALRRYNPPMGGEMAGQLIVMADDETVRFYEFIQILPRGDSLVYRLRHFNPDMSGWEDESGEPVEFPLVAIEGDSFYFDGLTLRRDGEDTIDVWVAIRSAEGEPGVIQSRFTRSEP